MTECEHYRARYLPLRPTGHASPHVRRGPVDLLERHLAGRQLRGEQRFREGCGDPWMVQRWGQAGWCICRCVEQQTLGRVRARSRRCRVVVVVVVVASIRLCDQDEGGYRHTRSQAVQRVRTAPGEAPCDPSSESMRIYKAVGNGGEADMRPVPPRPCQSSQQPFIPSLPPKFPLAKFRPTFLDRRRRLLQHWLCAILLHPEIGGCQAVRDWVMDKS